MFGHKACKEGDRTEYPPATCMTQITAALMLIPCLEPGTRNYILIVAVDICEAHANTSAR